MMVSSSPSPETSPSDIPRGGWVDRLTPPWTRPYIRLARFDRPIGTWLLLWPCWWSLALAADGWPDPWLVAAFAGNMLGVRLRPWFFMERKVVSRADG